MASAPAAMAASAPSAPSQTAREGPRRPASMAKTASAPARGFARARHESRARQRLGPRGGAVPDPDLGARADQPGRHGATHVAEPEKSHHRHRHLPRRLARVYNIDTPKFVWPGPPARSTLAAPNPESIHGRSPLSEAGNAEPARGPEAGPALRRPGGADLPDHLLRLSRYRPRRRALQPGARGPHLQPHLQPHRGGAGGADRGARRRRRRGLHGERPGGRCIWRS